MKISIFTLLMPLSLFAYEVRAEEPNPHTQMILDFNGSLVLKMKAKELVFIQKNIQKSAVDQVILVKSNDFFDQSDSRYNIRCWATKEVKVAANTAVSGIDQSRVGVDELSLEVSGSDIDTVGKEILLPVKGSKDIKSISCLKKLHTAPSSPAEIHVLTMADLPRIFNVVEKKEMVIKDKQKLSLPAEKMQKMCKITFDPRKTS